MERVAGRRLAALAALLVACGGGGGGGSGGPQTTTSGDAISFEGFAFRVSGELRDSPPIEDLAAIPPSIGAPLDTTIVFRFSGPPQGALDAASLPVFTTFAEATPEAEVPASTPIVLAKGTYVAVGDTVEFRPSVPSQPLEVNLGAPADAQPGLLPASVYTVRVSSEIGTKLPNLVGPGDEVHFQTTSIAAAYYPAAAGGADAPTVVGAEPPDGTVGFFPGLFDVQALGSDAAEAPRQWTLTYDRRIDPSGKNVGGQDLDGDGRVDPTFFVRARATRVLIGHRVPADALVPGQEPFPAVSALSDGPVAESPGDAVFLHGSADGSLPDPDSALTATPVSLALAADPSLLYLLLETVDGPERLTVADPVLGDPGAAELAVAADGLPATLDTTLQEAVGLTTLLDGRLVVYDRASGRIVELLPVVERVRPTVDAPAGVPLLLSLAIGDGELGFLGAPLAPPGALDVRDLAISPAGRLVALGTLPGETSSSVVRLAPIDPDADGVFESDEGTWSGDPADVLATLGALYDDVLFSGEQELLALDRATDRIDRVDLLTGSATPAYTDVAAYGLPLTSLPDGKSPARALAAGFMQLDVDVTVLSNETSGAVLRVDSSGVLPMGAELTLMERHTFASLASVSALSQDPGLPRLGATERTSVTSAGPQAGVIDDVFREEFEDTGMQDPTPLAVGTLAEWAAPSVGFTTTGGLRARAGALDGMELGDFRPLALPGFDAALAHPRGEHDAGFPERSLDLGLASYRIVILDTDAQNFPMTDGSTSGLTSPVTVLGGRFTFRDFIIPAGVHVLVRGSNPLVVTATNTLRIDGVLDVSGVDGVSDDTFNSGFLPVPGGPGGPGGGRGGEGHPITVDPGVPASFDQYATPERGGRGWGPLVDAMGQVSQAPVGGHGGLSTMGYRPNAVGLPLLPKADPNSTNAFLSQPGSTNNEYHRPPGGGGGSFYVRGDVAHEGAGSYLVQSGSTFAPFTRCPENDDIVSALYGNDENRTINMLAGQVVATPFMPLQCVYLDGGLDGLKRLQPGGAPGDLVFKDGDAGNDYIGIGGELEVLVGGQGGGGGGSRVDSMRQTLWANDAFGGPSPLGPPHYPALLGPPALSPTVFDAKGGGGGGGGGTVLLRSFGDIVIGRTGHIDARGGHGGGGEQVQNSNFAGGGGGGSGGAILLEAAGTIRLEADPDHRSASYTDASGAEGASLEVSGGFGRDARTQPENIITLAPFRWEVTRSDGGQGGFGLIQLQTGDGSAPVIEQGAFLFAKKRAELKLGAWSGDQGLQAEHPDIGANQPDELHYVDMLHYRHVFTEFVPETPDEVPDPLETRDHYLVLNGSWPPIIPSDGASAPPWESPPGGAAFLDTPMMEYPPGSGRRVVVEPQPDRVIKVYTALDASGLQEVNIGPGDPLADEFLGYPGSTYRDESIPLSIDLVEPDGTPPMEVVAGVEQFAPDNLIDRLPVVPPGSVPVTGGFLSQGTSVWLDFNGATVRARDVDGRTPPFLEAFHGTFNASAGPVPIGKAGEVATGSSAVGVPASYMTNIAPFDPGLYGNGTPPDPPFNDVKVDAVEFSLPDAVTSNAKVAVRFQGAHPVRAGSRVPDGATLTPWVDDLTLLSGFALVRFRVVFDLGQDVETWPFGVDSYRPRVDWVRLRSRY